MKPYLERATDVASESQIAVQVLLSRANDDIELIPLRPHIGEYIAPEDFTARQLRPVGVIGLNGLEPHCAFKEPLDAPVLSGIARAFVAYVNVLISGTFAEQMKSAEIEQLRRLYSLPDTRIN